MLIKRLIRILIAQFELQTVIITLPRSIRSLLKECEAEGMIDIDNFIGASVKDFIGYRENLKSNNIIVNKKANIKALRIKLPRLLYWQLVIISTILKVNKSDIIFTALAYSIPVMLEEYQLQEDYALEQALNLEIEEEIV